MIESFIRRSIASHPVYVTGEIEPEFTRGFVRVPEGLAFRLVAGAFDVPSPLPAFAYRPSPVKDAWKTWFPGSMLTPILPGGILPLEPPRPPGNAEMP